MQLGCVCPDRFLGHHDSTCDLWQPAGKLNFAAHLISFNLRLQPPMSWDLDNTPTSGAERMMWRVAGAVGVVGAIAAILLK